MESTIRQSATTGNETSPFLMFNPIKGPLRRLILDAIVKEAVANPNYMPLQTIGTIHFAGFIFFDAFPDLGQGESPLRNQYLAFYSLFDGTWEAYMEDFADLIALDIDMVWCNCMGYPGAQPIPPFSAYLRHNEVPPEWSFAAYPMATVPDIGAALDLRSQFISLMGQVVGTTPEQFDVAYQSFLTSTQQNLG